MYLIQYVNAFMACEGLMERELEFKTAHAVVMLRHALKKHADFFAAEEMKLVEKYAKKTETGKIAWGKEGQFAFENTENAAKFKKEREALGMLELEEFVPMKAGKIQAVRPAVLEALCGFLEFEGCGENTASEEKQERKEEGR